jgi:cytoskeletal protein CcmA (bactofilin family)
VDLERETKMSATEGNGQDVYSKRGPMPRASAAELADERGRPEENLMSVIGTGITITGNIEAEVDLHIEGQVVGDVRCATLILGERSTVTGNIFAERVRVSGTVEGGIETIDLAIEAAARVNGDVTYSRLRIANGGVIAGSMTHKPVEDDTPEAALLKLADAEPEESPKVHYIE